MHPFSRQKPAGRFRDCGFYPYLTQQDGYFMQLEAFVKAKLLKYGRQSYPNWFFCNI